MRGQQAFPYDMQGQGQQQEMPTEINDVYDAPRFQMDGQTTQWLFNPEVEFEDLQRTLRGQFYNPDLKKVITRPEARLVNEEGVYSILSLVKTHLYKHVSLSNFSKEEINEIVADVTMAIIDKLELEWKKYDMKKTNLTTVRIVVENTIRANLLRALQGAAAKSLRDTHKSTEVITSADNKRRNKSFGIL